MHPGGVHTPIFSKGGGLGGLLADAYARLMGRSPEKGADTIVWLCTANEAAAATGRFWIDRREAVCELRDSRVEAELLGLCRRMAPRVVR